MSYNLIHGDCYEIIPTLKDKSIDLIITDPPYDFKNHGGGSLYKKGTKRMETLNKLNDLDCWEFRPKQFLNLIEPKLKDFYGYFFCNKMIVDEYITWAKERNYKFDILILSKLNAGTAFNGHHLNDIEYIVLIRKSGTYFNTKSQFDDYRKWYQVTCKKRIHPAEKPVELLERFVRVSCPEGGLIFDPFAGSGSTGIACLGERREFLGCEKNDEYYDLASKRLKERDDELNGVGSLFEGLI